jgi:hypothetical protein
MSGRFNSICGSSAEWCSVLRQMDRSGKLSPRQTNVLLDTVAHALDCEREAAREFLRRRIARERPRPGVTP